MPKTILLIDDNLDLTEVLKMVLEQEGYRVIVAYDGEAGLSELQRTAPDLIILDMNMPRMGGIEFFHKIYDAHQEKTRYPVLITTGRDNLKELFRDLNVDGFLVKPFDAPDFLREIQSIFLRKKKQDQIILSKGMPQEKRVLIVEDDARVYDSLVEMFAREGFRVSGAKTGTDAFERVFDAPPALMLIKLQLAEMPGDILAVKLQRMPKTMDIPLILYSAVSLDTEAWAELQEFGKKTGIQKILGTNDPDLVFKEAVTLFPKTR